MRTTGRALWQAAVLGTVLLLSGCATITTVRAVRLAGAAQLPTRAMIDSLEGTRHALSTYVEGQALAARLTGREAMAPQVLCTVRTVQANLRLRVIILRKLVMLYDRFIALSQFELVDDTAPIFDDLMIDVDRYEHLPDAAAAATAVGCQDRDPEAFADVQPTALPKAPLRARISHDAALLLSSQRIRSVLEKIRTLWDRERRTYLSVQKAAVLSQKTLARLLLTRFGTLSPATLLAPHLAGLGLSWDAYAFVQGRDKLTAEQQTALQESLLSAIELRAARLIAEEEARQTQQSELLQVLARQHAILEAGQPLDLRHISWYLMPLLKSVNISTCGGASPN